MIFSNRQEKIEGRIAQYRETILQCLGAFRAAITQYCRQGDRDAVKSSFSEVHKAESLADDMRRELEVLMYSKALFPESRGDILGLLETMDRVPNQAEYCVQIIFEQRIPIPKAFVPGMLQLVDVCYRCVEAMLESAAKLFSDYMAATVTVGKIDEIESEGDHIESELTEQVFESDMDGTDKILLRDLIEHVGAICDRAENVGDRIRIIVAKRGI